MLPRHPCGPLGRPKPDSATAGRCSGHARSCGDSAGPRTAATIPVAARVRQPHNSESSDEDAGFFNISVNRQPTLRAAQVRNCSARNTESHSTPSFARFSAAPSCLSISTSALSTCAPVKPVERALPNRPDRPARRPSCLSGEIQGTRANRATETRISAESLVSSAAWPKSDYPGKQAHAACYCCFGLIVNRFGCTLAPDQRSGA